MNTSLPAQDSIRAIDRAFDILEALAQTGAPAAMSDVADSIGLPRPTVHRVLRTLVTRGYVIQLANHRYRLSTRITTLARHATSGLGSALQPLLSRAVEETRESASIALLDGDKARYIAHASSDQTVRVFQQVGNSASLHSTGTGKAILSRMTDDEATAVINRLSLQAITPNTITEPTALLREIRSIRERGYSFDNAEHELGVLCVATPIPGSLPLAVSISGPESRMTPGFIEKTCLPVLKSLARQLGKICAQFSGDPVS